MYRGFGKRCADLMAAIFLLVVLSPVLFLVAVLVRVSDPGPIIFRQLRIGRNGKPFVFLKFRSMPVDTGDVPSDQLGQVKLTLIGRIIRRTNIDELPQLFNIIRGDMSIVGPRPALTSQTQLLETRISNGASCCRPGLTGLAQISSFDGMSVKQKAEYDGEYAASITLVNDALIILKTFGYLLKAPPVY